MELDTLIIILLALGFSAGMVVGKVWGISHNKDEGLKDE